MLGSSLNLCSLNELGQVTTMEATKMDQKPSITDCVLKHGGTAKTVKRYQPDQNACVTMKSRSYGILFKRQSNSLGIQLLWNSQKQLLADLF